MTFHRRHVRSFLFCLCLAGLSQSAPGEGDTVIYPVTSGHSFKQTSPRVTRPEPAVSSEPANDRTTYVTAKGDSLWSISRRYHIPVETLRRINRLTSDALQPGVLLLVSDSSTPNRPALDPASHSPAMATPRVKPSSPSPPPPQPENQPPPETPDTHPPLSAVEPPPATRPRVSHSVPPQLKLLDEAKKLAGFNLNYNQSWEPQGARRPLIMDCSNTSRYLYWKVAGIDIGRTASDQYYFLRLKNRAWDVPQNSQSEPDREYLDKNLQVGDLLFWENTYNSHRDPPITHVMVFLGKNSKSQWIMAGSQSAGCGLTNNHPGPDLYVFNPFRPSGGYSTWLGFVHKTGRFVAIGRPLDPPRDSSLASNPVVSVKSP
jgi:LysM repeat protein